MSRKQRRSLPILRTAVSKVSLGNAVRNYLFLLLLELVCNEHPRKKQNLNARWFFKTHSGFLQSFPHKGELPPALLFRPNFAVAKHIGRKGRIERFLATIMFFKAVEQLVRNKAVERLKEVFRDSLAVSRCLAFDIFGFDIV